MTFVYIPLAPSYSPVLAVWNILNFFCYRLVEIAYKRVATNECFYVVRWIKNSVSESVKSAMIPLSIYANFQLKKDISTQHSSIKTYFTTTEIGNQPAVVN